MSWKKEAATKSISIRVENNQEFREMWKHGKKLEKGDYMNRESHNLSERWQTRVDITLKSNKLWGTFIPIEYHRVEKHTDRKRRMSSYLIWLRSIK